MKPGNETIDLDLLAKEVVAAAKYVAIAKEESLKASRADSQARSNLNEAKNNLARQAAALETALAKLKAP